MSDAQKGLLAITGACLIWGVSTLFYKQLAHVAPAEVLAHRTLWSCGTFGLILLLQGRIGAIGAALRAPGQLGLALLSSAMISINWFLFIYAIGAGRALEASIGYYIFPLVAVVVGFFVLREALSGAQWLAVGLAAVAVLVLTVGLGVTPWISLVLAVSFALYGLLKRWIVAGPVVSVTVETLLLAPLALLWLGLAGQGAFTSSLHDGVLLALSGPMTAVPLILFSYAAKRVAMATMGLIQYLNPTLQFLVAWLIFREPVTGWHALALPLIWVALALYSVAALRAARRRPDISVGTSSTTV